MSIVNTKGVDISYANGNIDLSKVKNAGYKWVMIRCGYGSNETSQDDTQFASNVAKAEKLDMPWGVYLFSYACSTADAKSELAHIDRLLKAQKAKGYYPTLPIALDIEPSTYVSNKGGWTKSNLTNVATIILDGLANLGYYPMIYTGYTELDNMLSDHIRKDYDCWFAQWNSKPNAYKYNRLGMWQYGGETNYLESNSISGVGTIDKNYVYKDYPTIIKKGGYNGFTKSKVTTTNATTTTKTTTTITETQLRQKVANTINAWIGAVEGDSTHAEILKIYNSQNPLPVGYKMKTHDAWCAATVSAAWLKVGIAQYITTECGCGRFRDNAIKLGIWQENDAYVPKVGDAIIYNWGDNGVGDCKTGADHTGLVTAVNGKTSFTVAEGNTGGGSLGVVGTRTMQVNGRYIRGFITPDYATIAKKVAGKVTPDKTTTTTTTTTSVSAPSIWIQGVANGKWLSVVKDGSDFAGILGKSLVALAAKVSIGSIKYKVHIKGKGWLGEVTGFNSKDYNNGYAGNGNPAAKGTAIDAVKMYYTTPQDVVKKYGYYKVAYRVHLLGGKWLAWQYDAETTNGQDGYAGIIGKTIDGIEAKLVKA